MTLKRIIFTGLPALAPIAAWGAEGTAAPAPLTYSVVRLLGGFALIGALLVAFAWFARKGVLPGLKGGSKARLKVLEARTLGHRQAIYVVGYDKQRLLVASSPAGVQLLTHLPEAEAGELESAPAPSFAEALMQAVGKQ